MKGRTDALKTAVLAEIEARRAELDGATDLRRAEFIVFFDERSGELFDSVFRTESRRRIARRVPTGRDRMAVLAEP